MTNVSMISVNKHLRMIRRFLTRVQSFVNSQRELVRRRTRETKVVEFDDTRRIEMFPTGDGRPASFRIAWQDATLMDMRTRGTCESWPVGP